MTLKGVAKFRRKLTCGLKNDIRNLVNLIFMRAVESPKIGTLIGSVCSKYTNIYMTKYRRVMSHETEE